MLVPPRLNLRIFPLLFLAVASGAAAQIVAGFEDLPSPPALDDYTHLYDATGTGSTYDGVGWDSRFRVVGRDLRIDPDAPLFGLPHSGDYYVTNEADDGGDGLLLTTSLVLTGAWFGRDEYYGYGGGATAITIFALAGDTELASVHFELPETHDAQPEPLEFVDTSAFLALSGITGYRIDRTAGGEFADSWIADDFTFVEPTASVPEPSALALLAPFTAVVCIRRRRF